MSFASKPSKSRTTKREIATQARRTADSASTQMKTVVTFFKNLIKHVKEEAIEEYVEQDFAQAGQLKRDLNGLMNWRAGIDERLGLLELDMRSVDGLVFQMMQECKNLAAIGDLGSFTIAGHTLQSEDGVLAMIQPLPGKNITTQSTPA
jgi:hypothetical protein